MKPDLTCKWTSKPLPGWSERGGRFFESEEPCEHCGGTTEVIDCPSCGAPNCCVGCCEEWPREVPNEEA